jgi:hypothetical protein
VIGCPEEQPLADAAAHAALCDRLLVLGGQPALVAQQIGEERANEFARV